MGLLAMVNLMLDNDFEDMRFVPVMLYKKSWDTNKCFIWNVWICKEIPSDAFAQCLCVFVCQELECLQDHLDDLVSNCRDVVGNLTELESEVKKKKKMLLWFLQQFDSEIKKPQCLCLGAIVLCWTWDVWGGFGLILVRLVFQDIQIEALLIRACEPMIQSYCHVSCKSFFHHLKPYNKYTK